MRKLLIFTLVVLIGMFAVQGIAYGATLGDLRTMFKAKLSPNPNIFPDEIIDEINIRSAQIASIHGFCCPQIDTLILSVDTSEYLFFKNFLWVYGIKPIKAGAVTERAWQSINIDDVGKEWMLQTSFPNYYYSWTDNMIGVYPTPAVAETATVYSFAYLPDLSSIIDTVVYLAPDSQVTLQSMAVYVDADNNIYASDSTSIRKSTDGGLNWGDKLYTGSNGITSIFIASNGYIYAGEYGRTVIRSTDNGTSWDTTLTYKDDTSATWNIAEDTLDNLYIGEYSTGDESEERATVWKSTDDGVSWDTIYYDASMRHCHAVGVDPYSNHLYVALGEGGFFLRSTDQGTTWDTLCSGASYCHYTGLEFINVGTFRRRIVGQDEPYSKIVVTPNDTHWEIMYTPIKHGLIWPIRRPSGLYSVYAGYNASTGDSSYVTRLLVSRDLGTTWFIAKDYYSTTPTEIRHIANKVVNDWVFYTYHRSDGLFELRKFKEGVFVEDLDMKCVDLIMNLSTMQYWIRKGRTDKAVPYWNIAKSEIRKVRDAFLEKAYELIVAPKIIGGK